MVTLQISTAPTDFPHLVHILPHQLDVLGNEVDEILITLDTHKSKGRFSTGYKENLKPTQGLLEILKHKYSNLRVEQVDYSPYVEQKIADYFFERRTIPKKDFRGGPFYSYFFGLFATTNNLVFHLDSDILLGGDGPGNWIKTAVDLIQNRKDILIVSPHPGPPRTDGKLLSQTYQLATDLSHLKAYYFNSMSTRIFFLDKSIFRKQKIKIFPPAIKNIAKALIEKNPPYELPENLLSQFMKDNELRRLDFLGKNNDLWSLHPPYRTSSFYEQLPSLINKIRSDDLPISQRGFYDINDQLIDWTEARQKIQNNRWWKRLFRKHRLLLVL